MSTRSHLSDNQRRVICRLAFLMICLLPTSLAVYAVVHRPGPKDWANRIKAELGLEVRISSVVTPTPTSVVLHGVTLFDPDSESQSRLEEIRIGRSAEGMEVLLVEPIKIRTDAFASLLARCSERLQQVDFQPQPWQIKFNRLIITDLEFNDEFAVVNFAPAVLQIHSHNPDGGDRTRSKGLEAKLIAKTSGDTGSLVEVVYQTSADSAVLMIDTSIDDHGRPGALPCRLFRPWQVDMAWLGRRAEFCGKVQLQIDGGHRVHGTILGDVRNIELDRVAKLLNRPLTGVCSLIGIECGIEDSLIDSAKCRVISETGGKICRSLVAAANVLGIQTRLDSGTTSKQTVVPFSELAFDLRIEQGKLSISSQEVCEIHREDSSQPQSAFRVATDMDNNVLAICDNKSLVPLLEFAVLLNGDDADRELSLAFLDRFRIPAQRTARSNEPSPYIP